MTANCEDTWCMLWRLLTTIIGGRLNLTCFRHVHCSSERRDTSTLIAPASSKVQATLTAGYLPAYQEKEEWSSNRRNSSSSLAVLFALSSRPCRRLATPSDNRGRICGERNSHCGTSRWQWWRLELPGTQYLISHSTGVVLWRTLTTHLTLYRRISIPHLSHHCQEGEEERTRVSSRK